jgi:N-acetylmuramoyl-L-alanine amidase
VPDGVCDTQTWSALIEAAFQLGGRLLCLRTPMMRGDDVAELQLRLGALGFDAGRVDGIFGPLTQEAVAEFQRNAGLVSDSVCGDETITSLRRLQGRAGSATLTAVRERERLRTAVQTLGELRVAVGSDASPVASALSARVSAILQHADVDVLLTSGEWSAQASAANQFNADLYVGITVCGSTAVEAAYFGVDGFESLGGRRLAEAIINELPASPGWATGTAQAMRLPILRETRAPSVLVRLGDEHHVESNDDLVVTSMLRALEQWPLVASAGTLDH